MKKLIIITMLTVFCTLIHTGPEPPTVQAENDWHLRGSGGVVFTNSELQDGDFAGTGQFGFLRTVWGSGKVAVGYQYWDFNSDTISVENHTGKVYVSTRDLRELKTQLYFYSAGLFTHGNGEKFVEPNFNGGLGLLVPVMGYVPFAEFGASKMGSEWFYNFNIGLQIGLDPKRK